MKPERRIKEFKRMHEELTDPDKQEEARMKAARARRADNRKKDAGL